MTAEPNGILKWNIAEIARALKIKAGDVKDYFTDGRRVSFLLERRLAYEVIKGTLADSEGAGYDLLDIEGRKWEVRSISRGGIYFSPSYMVGSGRHFQKNGFLKKMEQIEGFIISDIENFPEVPFWILPKSIVGTWWRNGDLGQNAKITRHKALKLLADL